MFNSIFSFEGRIRRTEYGISFIILVIAQLLIGVMFASASNGSFNVAFFIFMLPVRFFFFAQGAKRCHDVNISGWYQLIPLVPLYLIFGNGVPGPNKYGDDPKLQTVNF
jgi:uncharacterized membrane protein YhaH (DUF805 family)